MSDHKINLGCFVELERILSAHKLEATVLSKTEEIEIYDVYGNTIHKKFAELLSGKEQCEVCVNDITDHFEKLKFPSMRGVAAGDASSVMKERGHHH